MSTDKDKDVYNLGIAYRAMFADIDATAKLLLEAMRKNLFNDVKRLEEHKYLFNDYDNFSEVMAFVRNSTFRTFLDKPMFDATVLEVAKSLKENLKKTIPKGVIQNPSFQMGFGDADEYSFNKVIQRPKRQME